jgi:hypothetical protein
MTTSPRMSQPETDDIENRPDMNTAQKWSQMDLLDLANCIRLNEPVEEIASFMCRSRREIRDKIAELEPSGELARLVEEAASEAVPDEPVVRQLYESPNGDAWFLVQDSETGGALVRHEANAPSGGRVTDVEIDEFVGGPQSLEQDALLRVIGGFIGHPQRAEAEEPGVGAGNEWSNAELKELDDMLLRGLSIAEIALRLRRDKIEVRDKVAEVGRACR